MLSSRHSLLRGSVFKRMYLVYTLIIILAIALLGFYLSGTIAALTRDQTLNYNLQQLSSMNTIFTQQMDTLRFVRSKVYTLWTSPNTVLLESIQVVLENDDPFTSAEQYGAFIEHADLVHTFFNFVQSSLQVEMALFQISGIDTNRGNINILWPSSSGGMMEYADEINAYIRAHPTRRGGSPGMFAFVSGKGQVYERNFYILYDHLDDDQLPATPFGYLITGYDTKVLSEHLDSFSYPLEGTAYILTEQGEVLFDSSGQIGGEVPDFFEDIQQLSSGEASDGYIYNIIHNKADKVYVVGRLPSAMLSAKGSETTRSILLVSGLSALVAVVLTILLTRTLQKRVHTVTEVMEAAESGDLTVRADVTPRGDEFDQIATSLNSMIGKIDDHIQAVYVSELARQKATLSQREAELFALQAQVNPHFLYNTLEIIRMQAIRNGDEDTALLIRWLATLFRRRIHSGSVVTIDDELSFCLSLTDILQAKFNGEVMIEVDFEPSLLAFGILKDLIQPPVENAFIHGFLTNEEAERVLILRGEQVGGDIRITIENNGRQIEPEALLDIQSRLGADLASEMRVTKHIGLLNVDRRIRLAYGDAYGVTVESGEGGTRVTLLIQALSPEALTERIGVQTQPERSE